MKKSIKQKPELPRLRHTVPDLRNLGVLVRVIVLVHGLAFATVLVREPVPRGWLDASLAFAGRLEFPLLCVILLLYVANRWLGQLRAGAWLGVVLVLAALVTAVTHELATVEGALLWREVLWAVVAAGFCVAYLDYRSQRFSPALAEARLHALNARIRPHFFFNALNGVLGVMRSEPRRAERALEELADLFRVLMGENRELVTLGAEIETCRRYLDIEHLRLGDRLGVRWSLDGCPLDALVPPLMLQPLLENAVYHGIEPAGSAAMIAIKARRRGSQIVVTVDNPLHTTRQFERRRGNRMALDNIRERLMLFFDLEARLEKEVRNNRYRVRIVLPYRRISQ